jgi:hypothetical protein
VTKRLHIKMLDEFISGFVGSTIAEIASKLAPPRKSSEFAAVPFETVERRNRPFYFAVMPIFLFGFFLPYPFVHVGHGSAGWFAGAVFGLPFAALLIYIAVIWCLLGGKRARELIFYFEAKQRTDIRLYYFFGAPLSLLGVISFVIFVWG